MPDGENSICATLCCTFGGNFARSIGHHAPEAPKPWTVWDVTALTRATGRLAGVATVAGVGATLVVVLTATGVARGVDDEHAASTATAAVSATRFNAPDPFDATFDDDTTVRSPRAA